MRNKGFYTRFHDRYFEILNAYNNNVIQVFFDISLKEDLKEIRNKLIHYYVFLKNNPDYSIDKNILEEIKKQQK